MSCRADVDSKILPARRLRKSQEKKRGKEIETKCTGKRSDLAFDINLSERGRSRTLKEGPGLASQKSDVIRSIFQQMLTLVVDDKLGRISIRLESEFLSDEAELDIRLVSVSQLVQFS
jgi:hypothetical protein